MGIKPSLSCFPPQGKQNSSLGNGLGCSSPCPFSDSVHPAVGLARPRNLSTLPLPGQPQRPAKAGSPERMW